MLGERWRNPLLLLAAGGNPIVPTGTGTTGCRRGGDGVVSDFTPHIPANGALASGDAVPLIARPPNFSSGFSTDELWVAAGSFHLTGHLTFHLLLRVTLTPAGIRGSSASAAFPTFAAQQIFGLWYRASCSHSLRLAAWGSQPSVLDAWPPDAPLP